MKNIFIFCLSLSCLCAGTFSSIANPAGEAVKAGSATITRNGPGSLTINQATDKVIIDWNSFSIGAGEVTRFIQPGANAAALNRVLGGNPSAIYGMLEANGAVYVINPSGILVGPSGVINTRSFAGSTLDVNDASFLSGVGMRFSGNSTASVRNEGTINGLGGDIFLFAHTVENAGSLSASGGTVGLGAGSEILLRQSGNERVSVLAGNVNAPKTANGVNNAGAVQAASAELKAAGGNMYALAINNGGIVRADTLVNEGGRILLKASGGNIQNSGTLAASGSAGNGGTITVDGGHNAAAPATVTSSGTIAARGVGGKGGDVKILGDHVGLFGDALVDVSGDAGGGTALIGGDYRGQNPTVQNASRTVIGPDARIQADSLIDGDGGKVIVWADDTTWFGGTISARGGAEGGNGGFGEVSGKESLSFRGAADLRADRGFEGTLLLDPGTLSIIDGAGPGTQDGNLPQILQGAADAGGNTIAEQTLEALGATANIILEATSDITIQNLTDNLLNLALTTGSLRITADANNNGTGDFSMNSGDTIGTQGGNVSISGVNVTVGDVNTTSAGTIALDSTADITINGNMTAGSVVVHSGTDGGGNLSFGAAVTVRADDQSYQAGNGTGGGTGASVDLTGNTPAFRNTIGGAAPMIFSYRQDGTIADAAIPAATQFGGAAPGTYTIQSDDGGITLSTGAKVADSILTLLAADALAINGSLTLASLVARSGTDGSGNLSFGAGVTVRADDQSYQAGNGTGGGTGASVDLIGNTPAFRNTADDAAPETFVYRQDQDIADGDIPSIAPTTSYSIQSDDGGVILPTLTLPGNLIVTAGAGTITDLTDADLSVIGNASFTASGAITLGNEVNNADTFGSLTFNTVGTATINEDDAMVLSGSSSAGSAALTAEAGTITDASDADVNVTGNASFAASGAGGGITVGDQVNNADTFGSLTFNTVGAASISENDAMVLSGSSGAASAVLTAEVGTITDASDADVNVTGNASFAASGAGGAITLGDQGNNADTFGSLTFNTVGTVTISEDDAMVLSASSGAGSAALAAEVGTITDASDADVNVTGNASFAASGAGGGVTVGDEANNADTFGSLTFNTVGAVNVSEDNAMVLSGSSGAASAVLAAEVGTITDASDADVNVTGNASFTANAAGGAITVGDEANNADTFGSLTFNTVGAVNVSEDNAMVLLGSSGAASAVLTAEVGTITDASDADVNVTGNASFTANGAGGAIAVGDEANNADTFGSLTFNTVGAASIGEDDAMVLSGSSGAGSAALVAEVGAITDASDADVNVTGNASFTASGAGGAITLGDQGNNADTFGSLTFNTVGAVNVSEDDGMVLSGSSGVASAVLTAEAGTITDASDADVNVTGNASFTASGAGGAITLGDQGNNADTFGNLTFNTVGAASISEDDAMVLSGSSSVASAVLTAEAGTITDASDADVNVTGNASFTANGAGGGVNVGDEVNNVDTFGSLTFNTVGAASISENDAMVLSGSGNSGSAVLTAEAGTITDASDADLNVTGNASFTANGAGGGVTVGDEANNADTFGSLTFNTVGAASIGENDAMVLSGNSGAVSAVLTAEVGTINDASDADVNVTGNASFTASGAGGGITVGDEANNADTFGSLTFNTVGAASISEDDAMVMSGSGSAGSTVLTAEVGTITDASDSDVNVTGNASFTASGAGGGITLGDEANNADTFGSLTFNTVGAASINEDDAMILSGSGSAGSTVLTAEVGTITDASDADVNVTGNASFTANGAGGGVNVGDQGNNTDTFGSLTFNTVGAASISENDAMVLSGSGNSGSAVLTAEAGTITDASDADLNVTGNASFTANGAGGAITVGDEVNNVDTFGTLTFNSAGVVTITEASTTTLAGASTAGTLVLTSAGSIDDGAAATMQVSGNATFSVPADNLITLNNAGHEFAETPRLFIGGVQVEFKTGEDAKFFLDLLNLVVFSGVDATTKANDLPLERPPTIWTSSYHIYLNEQQEKEDEKKKRRRLIQAQIDPVGKVILARE